MGSSPDRRRSGSFQVPPKRSSSVLRAGCSSASRRRRSRSSSTLRCFDLDQRLGRRHVLGRADDDLDGEIVAGDLLERGCAAAAAARAGGRRRSPCRSRATSWSLVAARAAAPAPARRAAARCSMHRLDQLGEALRRGALRCAAPARRGVRRDGGAAARRRRGDGVATGAATGRRPPLRRCRRPSRRATRAPRAWPTARRSAPAARRGVSSTRPTSST